MMKKNFISKSILLACALMFGACLSASAQGDDYSFPVKYQGQRPTISDFVTAILSQDDLGELLGGISEQWELHRKGKKTEGDFMVNTKNGYIRYVHKIDDEGSHFESVTEFCYWNMKDNRHKLVAVNSHFTENGRDVFTEHSGPSFYLYDSQTCRMDGADMEKLGVSYSVEERPTVYHLPQVGKDINLTLNPPYEKPNEPKLYRKYVWDGMKFHLEKVTQDLMPKAQRMQGDYDVSLRIVDAGGKNPGYEAIFRMNGKALQVLEARAEERPSNMEKFGNVIQKDVNFDGYDDLLICLGGQAVSDQLFMYYDAWIFNPHTLGQGPFTLYKDFRDITNAEVDTANKRILSHYLVRDGVTYNYTQLRWQNGELKVAGQSWNEKKKLVVK